MKDKTKKPANYGWISTLEEGESSRIPWQNRAGAYNYARRTNCKVTIRREGEWARVIRLAD